MPIQQASFNLNDPDLYVVPKAFWWRPGSQLVAGSAINWDYVVPEGHFWLVDRLTVSSNNTTNYQVSCVISTGDNYGDTNYDTTNNESAFMYYVGYADTPTATAGLSNIPYPGSCVVIADKNLPLYLPSGTRLQIYSENNEYTSAYMAFKDYHY